MLSGKEQPLGFAYAASTQITHPSAYQHTSAHSVSEQALKLARFAYVRAQGNNPAALSKGGLESISVIQTVSKAIERAFRDEEFACLSFEQQEIAAAHLTNQCLAGMRVVKALQGAMLNPYTMAAQLKNNALSPHEQHNVFDHIISAHRPSTLISHIAAHEIETLPPGNA